MEKSKNSIIPAFIGKQVWAVKNAYRLNKLKKDILNHYAQIPENQIDSEKKIALDFLKENGVAVFPYPFQKRYSRDQVQVFQDETSGLYYVMLDGKRLFFKRSLSKKDIQQSFYFLEMEQDPESPHRYLTSQFQVNQGDTVVDVGAAEGNFSLSVVEKASAIYLFETDAEWIEALEMTFKPWRDKVHIINKFVSDINDDRHVTLNDFFETKADFNFIKIDVDGAERPLLQGFDTILNSQKPLKIALCTYHQQQDEQEFTALLHQKGFHVTTSDNYMLFIFGEPLQPPYFRRGLIRAVRS